MTIPTFEEFEGFRTIYSDSELRNAIAIASAIREIVGSGGGSGGGGDASAANQTLEIAELVELNSSIATSLNRTLSQLEAAINAISTGLATSANQATQTSELTAIRNFTEPPDTATITEDTTPVAGSFQAIQILNEATFSAFTMSGLTGSMTGFAIPPNTLIYGNITGYTLSSGRVIAYGL